MAPNYIIYISLESINLNSIVCSARNRITAAAADIILYRRAGINNNIILVNLCVMLCIGLYRIT